MGGGRDATYEVSSSTTRNCYKERGDIYSSLPPPDQWFLNNYYFYLRGGMCADAK